MEGERRAVRELEKLLGKRKISTDPGVLEIYGVEASGHKGAPWAVAFPETPNDVRVILRHAYRHGYPVYPQGSATSLSGNAYPEEGGVVLSLERMRKIDGYSVEDWTVDVEPGVRIDELNSALAGTPLFFPVTPGSSRVATVGGAVASGAGGMTGVRYGTMRDWVLGLTIVLPDEDGSVVRIGCRTLKCRQGYDLVRLIVGSEGTLAVVVEATLRLAARPRPLEWAAGFPRDDEAAVNAVLEAKRMGLDLFMAEYMDEESVSHAAAALGVRPPRRPLLVLAASPSGDGALRSIMKEADSVNVRHAISHTGSAPPIVEELVELRRHLFHGQMMAAKARARGRGAPRVVIDDIAVPPSKALEAILEIRRLAREAGLPVAIGGHIGEGNLHPGIVFVEDGKDESERAAWLHREIARVAIKLGGTVSAEHGIGTEKRSLLKMELEDLGGVKALELMKAVKRVFDPRGILNPGKVI